MKLLIGLGNPETRYANTRHNAGFRVLDAYAAERGAVFQTKEKFHAQLAELTLGGEKVILAKPATYYNNSGEAARSLCDFYKLDPSDVLIIHDELALPFGTIRTRLGGSDAGNNGVKSITQHIGADTARIRIGIKNELRERLDDADFVLSHFTKDEDASLHETLVKKAIALIEDFVAGDFEHTTHS